VIASALQLRPASPMAPERRVHVVQGQYVVTAEPEVVLTTVLGSCIAACIRDPVAGVGGMNHFLLPGDADSDGLRYGVNSMELLVNGLLQRGARRDRLVAKLFGGARLMGGFADIGGQNALFAGTFLSDEGIAFAGGSVGGSHPRRVQFWPVSGRTRQAYVGMAEAAPELAPELAPPPQPRVDTDGALELF